MATYIMKFIWGIVIAPRRGRLSSFQRAEKQEQGTGQSILPGPPRNIEIPRCRGG